MGEEAALGEGVVGVHIVKALFEAVEVGGRIPRVGGKHEGSFSTLTVTLTALDRSRLYRGFIFQVNTNTLVSGYIVIGYTVFSGYTVFWPGPK